MRTRSLLWLAVLSLAGAACAGGTSKTGTPDAAADAGALADAPPATDLMLPDGGPADVVARDSPPPDPVLTPVMVRPPSDKSLLHLDCSLNAAGDGMALWRETDADSKSQVWASRLPRDHRAWLPAEQLGTRAATDIDRLGVSVDEQGRAVAVWNEFGGPDAGIVGARFVPVTGWTPPSRISGGWELTLVGSPAGDAVAFGVLEGAPPTLVRYAPASGWQRDTALTLDRAGFFFASPVGRGVLLWNQRVGAGPEHELFVSEYAPGGTWSAPLRLQEGRPFDHPLPMINSTIAPDGSALLVWNRGGEVKGELWAAARPAAGPWTPPHLLKDGDAALWNTTVVVRDGGDGLVVFESGEPPRRKVWAALHTGGQWQPALNLGQGSEWTTGALAPTGIAVVAWSTPGGVFARRYTPGRGWSATYLGFDDSAGVVDICAGIDAAGRGWIVWIGNSPQNVRAAALAD